MSNNNEAKLPKSCPMNGGNGEYSYSKNSNFQRRALIILKPFIEEAISEKFDVGNLFSNSNGTTTTFGIADLGCSTGPNTFLAMQIVMESIKRKYDEQLEFLVFFNDQAANDFNTLFTSLGKHDDYFAAGVPGSFHDRLFPQSSLHLVYSCYSLHWLSRVPPEVVDKGSPAWNNGKIFYPNASSDEVANAYAAQFGEDMDRFLNFRALEIVRGGMMLLIMLAAPDGIHHSQLDGAWIYDALASCLVDMASEGLISEALVHSFNVPNYFTCSKEMVKLVERNGCFSIQIMKLQETRIEEPVDMKAWAKHIRATLEAIVIQHFKIDQIICDQLFNRFYLKAMQFSVIDPSFKKGTLLFLALKRK